MHRARKQSLIILVALALSLIPRAAAAFHVGKTFQDPPGAGGGGGIYYLGTPLERGWNCSMCHVEAAGRIRVQLEVDPPELFSSFRYAPAASYTFKVRLVDEHRGLSSPLSNYNGLALAFTDPAGIYVGSLSGFDPNVFFNGNGVIATSGTNPGESNWTFTWTAPEGGPVTLYLGAVDGNGAESGASATLTDPFGDDVFMATVQLDAGPTASRAPPPKERRVHASPLVLCVLLLAFHGVGLVGTNLTSSGIVRRCGSYG